MALTERVVRKPAGADRGLVQIVLAALLWGTVGPTSQLLMQLGVTPALWVTTLRLGLAAPIVGLVAWMTLGRGLFRINARDLRPVLAIGVLTAFDQTAYITAISYTDAAVATLVSICLAPLVVAALGIIFLKELPTRRVVYSLGLALPGIALVVGLDPGRVTGSAPLLGVGLAIVSAFSYASIILIGRAVADRCHPLQVTSLGFLTGAVLLLGISLASGRAAPVPAPAWMPLLYLATLPTGLAYALFYRGVRTVPAAVASVTVLLEPLTATVLTWAFLGGDLGPERLAGGALLIGALLVLSIERPAPDPRP